MAKKKLTPKQKLFVQHYLKDLNALSAVKEVGIPFVTVPPKNVYYTYALVCPVENDIFYIGKGKGNRMLCHRRLTQGNQNKNLRIEKALTEHDDILYLILSRHEDELEAYATEELLINAIGYDNLTNINPVSCRRAPVHQKPAMPRPSDYRNFGDWVGVATEFLMSNRKLITWMGGQTTPEQQDMIIGAFQATVKTRFFPATRPSNG